MSKNERKITLDGEFQELQTTERDKNGEDQAIKTVEPVTLEKEHERFYDKLRLKVESFMLKRATKHPQAIKYILLAPDLFVLLARLVQDARVPFKSKAIAGVAIAYFISPIDLIPEVLTGPIGLLDDIVLAAYALNRILADTDKEILIEHWNGEADLLNTIQEVLSKAEELVGGKVHYLLNKILNKEGGK
jgi:uncharacterized membrane protein YkvA (DUF1232 family)